MKWIFGMFAAGIVTAAVMLAMGCQGLRTAADILDNIPETCTNAPPVVVTPPAPTTTTIAPQNGDAIDAAAIKTMGTRNRWHPKDQVVTLPAATYKFTSRGLEFTNPLGGQWGEIYMFFEHDGRWIGGQWDSTRGNQTFKELKNLVSHTNRDGKFEKSRFSGIEPQPGQTVYMCISDAGSDSRNPTKRNAITPVSNTWGSK